jgi:competence protein ComEC
MSAPALLIAIPLIAGVVAGALAGAGSRAGLIVLALAWLVAAVGLWRGRRAVVVAATVAGCLAAGVALGARASQAVAEPSLLVWFHEASARNDPVRLEAVLREDATPRPNSGPAPRPSPGQALQPAAVEGGLGVTVDAVTVDGRRADGGVRVTIAGALAAGRAREWRAGRTVAMTVVLREPLDYRDPGVPSDRARLARQGIVLLGSVKSAALTAVVARGSWLDEGAAALRAWVRRSTDAAVAPWSPRSAGVVTAILIGDRSGLEAEDERRLQEAGTYHVIAISGGNIALLTALLVGAGRAARLPGRATAAASIALLAFYGYAAGLAPSVLRATLAGMIYLAARALDHRGKALNALAVAGACAAVSAPLTVLDAGFVLSFGATVAIVTAASRLTPARTRERGAGRFRAMARWLVSAAAALCAATMCAEIALAPIGARLFGRVSVAGLLLNFAAIPLMSIIQVAGLAAVALAFVSDGAARVCGWIAHAGTSALIGSASLVDLAPWLVLDVPPPAMWVIVLWYAGWGGLWAAHEPPLHRWRRTVRRVAVAAICFTALTIVRAPAPASAFRVPDPPQGWTRVVFLDVGQGDATLVQPAGARPFLVDAGGVPGTTFDLGRRVTLPASWAFGVRRLGALVLTHGDPDHVGGAPAILRALSPIEVWDGVPVPRHEPLQNLRAAAARFGIPWIERRAGETLTAGAATLTVLNPPDPDWERQKVRNDDSIVLEVRVGHVAFILPGDITRAVEPDVVQRLVPAPLVIVKAPHHGSAGSSSPSFIDATHPAAVVFSAGRRNPFGHPAPVVVERYKAAGAAVFSTADDGAVVVDTDGAKVTMWTWTGRRLSLNAPGGLTPASNHSTLHAPTASHKGR